MMRRPIPGLFVLLALVTACDIPTAVPKWDMTWNVPVESESISVKSFLPSGVTAGTNAAFQFGVGAVTITRALSQDCAPCVLANMQNVPKPAFTGTGSSSATLPSGVTSATLSATGDTLTLTVTNNYNFDPLRPSAATPSARGFLKTVVTSGSTQIGKDSADGAVVSLPANGGTLQRKIPLSGTITGTSGVTVTVTLNSPAGDNVTIDATRSITFTAAATTLQVASAQVTVNQAITSTPTTIDLTSVGTAVTSRVNSGFFILTITNPLAATGVLTANFTGGTMPITKTISLGLGTVVDTVTFSGPDLQALFGHDIALTFTGPVAGVSFTVTPGQMVAVKSRLQINLETESQ